MRMPSPPQNRTTFMSDPRAVDNPALRRHRCGARPQHRIDTALVQQRLDPREPDVVGEHFPGQAVPDVAAVQLLHSAPYRPLGLEARDMARELVAVDLVTARI